MLQTELFLPQDEEKAATLNDILPNDHKHKSRLICPGGSCTGSSITHSWTKGHKGINTVLFERDNNLLVRSLLSITKWQPKSQNSALYILTSPMGLVLGLNWSRVRRRNVCCRTLLTLEIMLE